MQALLLALLVAPLLSGTDAPATPADTALNTSTLSLGQKADASEIPSWFKRKKRHQPAYRRLRRR